MSFRRPEWMKWYYTNWAESTALFDAEQKGWYFTLLMYAASQGEPPGYLEDNEETLKEIAGYTSLPRELLIVMSNEFNGDANAVAIRSQITGMMSVITGMREEKWRKVRRKFRKSSEFTGLIYNGKLVNTLKDAYDSQRKLNRAGRAGAEARWRKHNKDNELNSDRITNVLPPYNYTAGEIMASPMPPQSDPNGILDIDIKRKNIDTRYTRTIQKESAKDTVRQKAETLFDEGKFHVTEHMMNHLKSKFPDFTTGDFDYMTEKFKNVFYGKKYRSWARTFYNFVTNQVVLYSYTPGAFNWKREQEKYVKRERFEATTDKHSRLEREAEEYTRSLQGGGVGDNSEDSEALPLTSDDFR